MSGSVDDRAGLHVVGRGIVGSRLLRVLEGVGVVQHGGRSVPRGACRPGDVVVFAHGGDHAEPAVELLDRGVHVVTVGDSLADTERLLAMRPPRDAALVVGAAMSPGLSGLVARHLADGLAVVDEIHVAMHGTAGPACARDHHRSLSGRSPSWRDGRWVDVVGGSGRELCWFPEPVGAKDCYCARNASPLVLHRSFPEVARISVRRSARRRDRFTAWLPMLRPPHPEGGVGALRVEVRGADESGGRQVSIAGVAELVGTAAAATAAAFATAIADGLIGPGTWGAASPELPTLELLRRVGRFGVRLQEFTGIPQVSRSSGAEPLST